jgi:hypothetical protein
MSEHAESKEHVASPMTLSELERDRTAAVRQYELPRDEDEHFLCVYQHCSAPIRAADRTEAAFFLHLAAHDARGDRILPGVVAIVAHHRMRASNAAHTLSLHHHSAAAASASAVPPPSSASTPPPPHHQHHAPRLTVALRRKQLADARAAGLDIPPLPIPSPASAHFSTTTNNNNSATSTSSSRRLHLSASTASTTTLDDDAANSSAAKKSRRIDVTLHGYDLPILKQIGDGERIQLKCPLGNCPKVIQGFIYHLHSHLMAHRRAEGKGEPLVIRKDRQLDVKAKAIAARAAAAAAATNTNTMTTTTTTVSTRRSHSDDDASQFRTSSAATTLPKPVTTTAASIASPLTMHHRNGDDNDAAAAVDEDDAENHARVRRGVRRSRLAVNGDGDNDVSDDRSDDDADHADAAVRSAGAQFGEAGADDDDDGDDDDDDDVVDNDEDDDDDDGNVDDDDDDDADVDDDDDEAPRKSLKRKAPMSAGGGAHGESKVTAETVLIFCDDPRWRPLSERADLLREFIGKYGVGLFRQNLAGDFLCFFRGCGAMMLQNFSRHLVRHERDNTPVDPALQALADEFHRQRGSTLLSEGQ